MIQHQGPHRLKITHGCLAGGQPCPEGAIVEVDDVIAFDLLNLGYAEPADEASATRYRQNMRWGWIDRDATEPGPRIRLVKAA